MVSAPIFTYLVALIGLLLVAAGGLSWWTVVVVGLVVYVVERELYDVRRFAAGDDASDEPHRPRR
jgi:hypothetical protein